jgi:hypothetical protein
VVPRPVDEISERSSTIVLSRLACKAALMGRMLALLMVAGLLLGCGDSDESSNSDAVSSDSGSDDPGPAEMLAALDGARTESAYQAQLSRLASACGMTPIEVADLAVHASRNVAPEQGVSISISEMLDAIEQNAGGPVSCEEVAAATITLMME